MRFLIVCFVIGFFLNESILATSNNKKSVNESPSTSANQLPGMVVRELLKTNTNIVDWIYSMLRLELLLNNSKEIEKLIPVKDFTIKPLLIQPIMTQISLTTTGTTTPETTTETAIETTTETTTETTIESTTETTIESTTESTTETTTEAATEATSTGNSSQVKPTVENKCASETRNILFPVLGDCHQFYTCLAGTQYTFLCPEGLHFRFKKQGCAPAKNEDCF